MSPGSAGNYYVNMSVANRGTTEGAARTSVLKVTYSGVSNQITLTQEANTVSFGELNGGAASASDIPASGGSVTATYTLPSQK